jgi:transposase
MRHLTFTEADIRDLLYYRYHHPHPRVQLRMEVVWLKSQGLPHQEISRLAGVSANTVRRYLDAFAHGGIAELQRVRFRRPHSELDTHAESLADYFRRHPPATIKEARAKVEELTGIQRSPTQVRSFFRRLGLRRRKVGRLPHDPDTEEQHAFLHDQLEPRLKQAKKGQRAVLFVDAVHWVFTAFLGYVWCFTRLFVRSPAGRRRLSVLGAVDAISHEFHALHTTATITSSEVKDFLLQLAEAYRGQRLTVVWDNAPYFLDGKVRALAALLGIEVLPLPSHSPNLNLIERLWRFLKKQCLYSKYYADFSSFQSHILHELAVTPAKYRKELASLLTLNFQNLEESFLHTIGEDEEPVGTVKRVA